MRETSPATVRQGKVTVTDFCLSYDTLEGPVEAVCDASIRVDPGEFVSIIGPSGCGKSTLLNAVAGFLKPSSGEVAVDGEGVAGPSADRGMVFQQYSLFPWKTVRENVEFGLKMKGMGRSKRETSARTLLGLAGLLAFENQYPESLSGGMKQRVGIIRALATSPKVLLLDEPFGSLDAQTRLIMQQILTNMWQRLKTSVLFVTHDIEEALRLATVIAIMDSGRIVQLGTPIEILEQPANDFVRDFVGRRGLGLKLLSVRKVADRLRCGEPAEGEPLSLDASLSEALSAMTARRADRVSVCDDEGRHLGIIALADLVR